MNNLYIDLKKESEIVKSQFDLVDFLSLGDLIEKFEELVYENEELKEKIEDLKNEKEDEEWIKADIALHERMQDF